VQQQHIQEMHICRQALSISHLLFTDDTLLFIKASEEQAVMIKEVLQVYERHRAAGEPVEVLNAIR
jgi:hypothetical protein